MQGIHTIFDQRRQHRDEDRADYIARPLTFNLITRLAEPELESSFLADRGQITTNRQVKPAKPR